MNQQHPIPQGSLCLCPGGYKQDPGAEAAAQGKAGPDCGSPALLGLRAGSQILGNPSGLLNKGQIWILTLACLPCLKHSLASFCPELLGKAGSLGTRPQPGQPQPHIKVHMGHLEFQAKTRELRKQE